MGGGVRLSAGALFSRADGWLTSSHAFFKCLDRLTNKGVTGRVRVWAVFPLVQMRERCFEPYNLLFRGCDVILYDYIFSEVRTRFILHNCYGNSSIVYFLYDACKLFRSNKSNISCRRMPSDVWSGRRR